MFQFGKLQGLSKLLLCCVISVGILILAGCTEKSPESSASDPVENGVSGSENHKSISKLNIAIPQDAGPLNIYSNSSSSDYLVGLVFDKLFAPSPYVDEPQP